MLNAKSLKGIIPAVPTPVTTDNVVDVEASNAMFSWLSKQGVDGILTLGGTGEYGALSRMERGRFVGLTAQAIDKKVPVIAGVLDTGFYDACASGKELASAGADALLVLTPYYTNPTQNGLRDYFMRYADASPVPVLIYEIPYRTRVAISPDVLHELSRHENIIGMKACNTDMYHFLRIMAGVGSDFAVLSGEDTLFPLHMVAGAVGGIVVTATMLPKAWRRVFDLCSQGRLDESLKIHQALIPMMNLAFAETNPGPMKAVLDMVGVNAPHVLMPLEQPAETLRASLRAVYGELLERFEYSGK